MTKNKVNTGSFSLCLSFKRLSCFALSCSILVLSGCENLSMPKFGDEKKTLNTETEELRDEISYTEQRQAARGYNTKNMFGRSLRNDGERLDRLERAVQDMRNEFDSVRPSIKRLVSLEGDIQRLIRELKTLNEEEAHQASKPRKPIERNYNAVASKNTSPKYTPPAKSSYQKKSPPPVKNGAASVYDLRIGEHPGRTRLVMDVNAKTSFSTDIDNGENIMVIELPNANWTTAKSRNFGKSNFISSYKVESAGNGHMLIIQLKRDAKVSYKDDLAGKNGGRRLVIDLIGS